MSPGRSGSFHYFFLVWFDLIENKLSLKRRRDGNHQFFFLFRIDWRQKFCRFSFSHEKYRSFSAGRQEVLLCFGNFVEVLKLWEEVFRRKEEKEIKENVHRGRRFAKCKSLMSFYVSYVFLFCNFLLMFLGFSSFKNCIFLVFCNGETISFIVRFLF